MKTGKGIGKKLLYFAEQQAKENGYKESIIWAFKENIRALSFYQKCGYSIDKEEYLGEPQFWG
ncbi:MAG: GNAT family N-acetyltransferase [Lachnospiraceae bacterium]|nr:GNAT family N-acetyltransferase [Lachnospiraceae bacterium]